MTQTDKPSVEEMNRKIAEFMGYKFYDDDKEDYPNGYWQNDWVVVNELKYHSSWDELMPVGKKIYDWLAAQCKGRPANSCTDGDLLEVDIHCAIREYNIKKAHEAIYQFVLWYEAYQATLKQQ